jgi:hypothetical protein
MCKGIPLAPNHYSAQSVLSVLLPRPERNRKGTPRARKGAQQGPNKGGPKGAREGEGGAAAAATAARRGSGAAPCPGVVEGEDGEEELDDDEGERERTRERGTSGEEQFEDVEP